MSIGYACKIIGPEQIVMKGCALKNATEDRLMALIGHNLSALDAMLSYNQANEIRLFRISSDIIPFGSGLASTFPWQLRFSETLRAVGNKANASAIRLSMHPGQYTVLNTPDPAVLQRAIADLQYHANFLDSLGLDSSHKLILHVGGVYGNKLAALKRFSDHYKDLPDAIKRRLVIENDDRCYHIGDVLELAGQLKIPVVYDTLHNRVNCCDPTKDDLYWISQCASTWEKPDGRQKIHYSQQDGTKKAGSHSQTIDLEEFLAFYRGLGNVQPDIMLEVKDKNLSAVKCIHCTAPQGSMQVLEEAWSRYKYSILERAPNDYQAIRALLKNKADYPALPFYRLIQHGMSQKVTPGGFKNAALHVWGYVKEQATPKEKERFFQLLEASQADPSNFTKVKRLLYQLSQKYHQSYLLLSYYFIL